MAIQDICVIGSTSDHGGVVITGDSNVLVNGKPVSRKGDLHDCPIHGITSIVSACVETFIIDGQPVARITSICECGAKIITGEPMKV